MGRSIYVVQRERMEPGDPDLVIVALNTAELYRRQGDLASAESVLQESADRAIEHLPRPHKMRGIVLGDLAEVQLDRERVELATENALRALDELEAFPGLRPDSLVGTQVLLARCLFASGEHERAVPFLEIAWEALPAGHPAFRGVAEEIVDLLERTLTELGRVDEASAWRAKRPGGG